MKERENLKNVKILYVEDDTDARMELTTVLKRHVGKIYTAADGRDGLELFRTCEPDIVIADLLMPNMNGIEMIQQMHSEKKNRLPATVVVSALGDSDTIINAVDVGIDKYIIKPVDTDELMDSLEKIAESICERKRIEALPCVLNPGIVGDEIKREISTLMKKMTGKGPRDVSTFVNAEGIEVVAHEILTPFEKTLYDNSKSASVVKYTREVFFSSTEQQFCEMIESLMGRKVTMQKAQINVPADKIKLKFLFVE